MITNLKSKLDKKTAVLERKFAFPNRSISDWLRLTAALLEENLSAARRIRSRLNRFENVMVKVYSIYLLILLKVRKK